MRSDPLSQARYCLERLVVADLDKALERPENRRSSWRFQYKIDRPALLKARSQWVTSGERAGAARVIRAEILRHSLLVLAVATAGITFLRGSPFPQDPTYHLMADERLLFGVPNCLNVLSNLPFALVGMLGLRTIFRREAGSATSFRDPWERWPYAALFGGIALTTLGSSYYHLSPDNARLVWDRLPMTLGFMGLLTALLGERVRLRVGRLLFGPLLLVGASSVAHWYWSELHGQGDLRFYYLVQYGSLLLVLVLLLLYPARYPGTGYVLVALGAYAGAKWLEAADHRIFALGQMVSGHTLKHLAAAGAVACLVGMLRVRLRRGAASGVSNLITPHPSGSASPTG